MPPARRTEPLNAPIPALARLALLLVAVLALSAPGARAAEAPIELGAYYCPGSVCDATGADALDSYRERFGRYPSIALNFRNLDQPLLYPHEEEVLDNRGVVPMITVEPLLTRDGSEVEVPVAAIAAGRYDEMIREDARIAARHDGPILLRWAQEMNGTWFAERSADPEAFVASWIRFVEIFREEGAANVAFAWTPSVEGIAGAKPMELYFPGERYVDYVGLDGYNWGHGNWRSFGEVFADSYERLTRLSSKPVVIGETGSAPGPAKGEWIRSAFLRELPRRFPAVVAVVWFSKDLSRAGQRDWRIETSPEAAAAWREVGDSTLYGGTTPPPAEESGRRPEPAPLLQRLLDVALGLWHLAGVLTRN